MCGIVAYIGFKEALPILLSGLKRLEYRGYDSAGDSLLLPSGIKTYKKQGKVAEIEKIVPPNLEKAFIGCLLYTSDAADE